MARFVGGHNSVSEEAQNSPLNSAIQSTELLRGRLLELNRPSQARAPGPPARFSVLCVRERQYPIGSPRDPPDTGGSPASRSSSCSARSASPTVPSAFRDRALAECQACLCPLPY